jgi:hypothetical protein
VEFFKNEAHPVEIPLFGKNRNLTVEGQLAKEPKMFALMKVAQQIRDVWLREDRAEAEARRGGSRNQKTGRRSRMKRSRRKPCPKQKPLVNIRSGVQAKVAA